MKLMVVGYGGRGKTSLLQALKKKIRSSIIEKPPVTVGVIVDDWKYVHKEDICIVTHYLTFCFSIEQTTLLYREIDCLLYCSANTYPFKFCSQCIFAFFKDSFFNTVYVFSFCLSSHFGHLSADMNDRETIAQ